MDLFENTEASTSASGGRGRTIDHSAFACSSALHAALDISSGSIVHAWFPLATSGL